MVDWSRLQKVKGDRLLVVKAACPLFIPYTEMSIYQCLAPLPHVADRYFECATLLNELLHAHPYTTPTGHQELGGKIEWSIEKLEAAIKNFDEVSVLNGDLLYGELAKAWGKAGKKEGAGVGAAD